MMVMIDDIPFRITREDGGRSLIINDLSKADEGAYVVTFRMSGVVRGSNNGQLEVIEKIVPLGDVYDYATVQGINSVISNQ